MSTDLGALRLGRRRARRPRLSRSARLLDVAAGLVLVLVSAPVMLVIAVVVRLSGPGPVLFRQERIGLRQRPFRMLKFRTMTVGCGDEVHRAYVTRQLLADEPTTGGASGLYKLEHDPRVTRVGRVLRRTSLDELPQLFNVLRGQMALVGPRPMLPWEVQLIPAAAVRRFTVRPGMTGLWQTSGRSRMTMRQGLELDLEYVARRSLRMDLWLLLKTVRVVLTPGSAR